MLFYGIRSLLSHQWFVKPAVVYSLATIKVSFCHAGTTHLPFWCSHQCKHVPMVLNVLWLNYIKFYLFNYSIIDNLIMSPLVCQDCITTSRGDLSRFSLTVKLRISTIFLVKVILCILSIILWVPLWHPWTILFIKS